MIRRLLRSTRATVVTSTVVCVVLSACAEAVAAEALTSATKAVLAENDRAREKFRLGVNAMRAGRFEEARQLLTEAWQLRRTYDVAATLAQVENELGHRARAAAFLDFCMNNFAPIESDNNFQQLAQAFDEARRRVGRIDLSSVPPGTEIRVDGQTLGITPFELPMYLEPGPHRLSFRLGNRSHERALLVKGGSQFRAIEDAAVVPSAITSGAGLVRVANGAVQPDGADASPKRPTLPYYIGASLAVSGVVFAVANQVAASHAHEERAVALRGCAAATLPSTDICRQAAIATADHAYFLNLATFGYGLAATAVAATAVYWIWPEPRRPKSVALASPTWSVGCSPTRVWLAATGAIPW